MHALPVAGNSVLPVTAFTQVIHLHLFPASSCIHKKEFIANSKLDFWLNIFVSSHCDFHGLLDVKGESNL